MNSELYFNQKKYISAKRASEISGYNADYIGQLCRSGKLECRQVGRGWFVSEDSIIEHQKSASEKVRGVILFPPVTVVSKNADISFPQESNFKVFSLSEICAPFGKMTSLVSGMFFLVFLMGLFSYGAYNKTVQQYVAVRSAEFITFEKQAISHIAQETSKTLALVRDAVVETSGSNLAKKNTKNIFSSISDSFNMLSLRSYRFISSLLHLNAPRTVVVRDDVSEDFETTSHSSVSQDSEMGMIVVPSTGETSQDEKVKSRIKKSFSDETRVIPDETGTSGVIQPVFKHTQDQDYLYVLVPVDD